MENKISSITIKKVNVDNFDAFLGLIAGLAEYEKLAPPDEAAKKRLRVDCLSDKPKYEALIGEFDGKAVSYVIYFFTYSSFLAQPTLYLEDIFVLEEYRRRGIGGKMFQACREIAKQNQCGRLEFTVLKWNKSAQKFYEKNKTERLEWYFYRLVEKNF